MSTDQVCRVLDRLAEAGVLNLTLTGGEIFLRKDFSEIYAHALRCGFLVNLYTNATLVDEQIAQRLRANPPRRIEVSMYGNSEAVYENVTGGRGSFNKFQKGIHLLLQQELPVYIKMLVTKDNEHEFDAVRKWAESHARAFRYDVVVSPGLDGDGAPLACRVSPERVVELQLKESGARDAFIDLAMIEENPIREGRVLLCGAGTRTFCVDPYGQLHPCMLWRRHPYDLVENSIDDNWHKHLAAIKSLPCDPDAVCYSCPDWWSCTNKCPAMAILETGRAGMPSEYHCNVCRIRNTQINGPQKEAQDEHRKKSL